MEEKGRTGGKFVGRSYGSLNVRALLRGRKVPDFARCGTLQKYEGIQSLGPAKKGAAAAK